jgi:U32 family peptidase
MKNNIEIMAPAGNFDSLMTAINAGAQSVYFGVGNLNMRSKSASFKDNDLEKIISICNKHSIKSYLTLNTVIYDDEIEKAKELVRKAKNSGISAIIASDIFVIKYCRELDVEVHLSTQCNITNIEAVRFYSQFVDAIVLARELTLKQISYICKTIRDEKIIGPNGELVKIEVFIHGALCISISGKCYMSIAQYNHSANRGQCLQPCRREYLLRDAETGDELVFNNGYVMSPSDLCTIEILDKLIETGVEILKIEGRGRGPEYVDVVVKSYSSALKLIKDGNFTNENKKCLISNLEKVFNRGFWHGGYYLGEKIGEWSGVYGSKAKEKKETLGFVENYFNEKEVAQINITTNKIEQGQEIMITGPTTGVVRFSVEEFFVNGIKSNLAKKNDDFTIKVPKKVRKNDSVFLIVKNNQ